MNRPIAYFITFHTHGSWLHGRADGSVDRTHNQPGTAFLPPDEDLQSRMRSVMNASPFELDHARRSTVRDTIINVCAHRRWRLLALHVRTNHVHVVVTADCVPEKVLNDLKSWCTRQLREARQISEEDRPWSRHGSTLYLWSEKSVEEKIDYTLHHQGVPLPGSTYSESTAAGDP